MLSELFTSVIPKLDALFYESWVVFNHISVVFMQEMLLNMITSVMNTACTNIATGSFK